MRIPVVALCWGSGSPAVPCAVKDINPAGAYIVTRERWYRGTIVKVSFRCGVRPREGSGAAAVQMRAKVLRHGLDGVGVRFVYLSKHERLRFEQFLAAARGRGSA